jgi:hypothetical protein
MKEKDANFERGHRMVLYVERPDRTYGPVETGSYMVQTYIDDFAGKRREAAETLAGRLARGEISPVAYFMELQELAPADLAERVGVRGRALRRHLTMAGFMEIDVTLLARYAEVFNIPLADLFQLVEASRPGDLRRERTGNPVVSRLRIDGGGQG